MIRLLLLSLLALSSCRPAEAADGERAAVTAAVERYFRGHATGDGAHFRQAFHPEARIFSVKDGKVASLSRDEFAARASGKPAADESRRRRKIISIDIAGDAAVAKVDLDYPDVHFIDYLALLRVDGSWVIINKVFHRAPPRR